MFTRLLNQEATVYRPSVSSFDDYGNAIEVFTPDEYTIPCRIQENVGDEDLADRDTVVRTATGYFDPDADLDAYMQVEVDGEMWKFDRHPVLRHDGRGPHHYEAGLRLVVA